MNNVVGGIIIVTSAIAGCGIVHLLRKRDNKKYFNDKMKQAMNNMYGEESK